MKTLFFLALLLAQCLRGATVEPHSLRQPAEWFYYHVRLGQPAKNLRFLWERYKVAPTMMSGARIRQRVRDLSAGKGIKKEFLPAALHPEASYWFWSHQGPMSDREMFIILSGDSLDTAVVVFATIEERLSL